MEIQRMKRNELGMGVERGEWKNILGRGNSLCMISQGWAVCLRPVCLGKARVAGGRVAMSLMRAEDSSLAFHLRERH